MHMYLFSVCLLGVPRNCDTLVTKGILCPGLDFQTPLFSNKKEPELLGEVFYSRTLQGKCKMSLKLLGVSESKEVLEER